MLISTQNRPYLKSVFNRPPEAKSCGNKVFRYSSYFAPLNKGKRFTLVCYSFISACVSGLLLGCSPTTVFRRVPFIRIDSIKRHSWFWFSHISKKVFELAPSFADFYSFFGIDMCIFKLRIGASGIHGTPRPVNSSPGKSVSFDFFGNQLGLFAPAGFGFSINNIIPIPCINLPATAFANKWVVDTVNNHPISEFFTSVIYHGFGVRLFQRKSQVC